ncbi:imidazole glycerol phosphate synthase, glutamine amidotransferase subunit [Candidatus Magnetomorum sp. HK-1]|nr:imidazole glycerol phosphate synthase, glutamine amidotransferase subunit [Candidatus Magnetomorum sp. HK-1]
MNNNKKISVAIIDYEMGNLFSISNACKYVGIEPCITNSKTDIIQSDAIILPGVGAFGDAIKSLIKLDLVSPIIDFVASGKHIFGICLGMQLLMAKSFEFGEHNGLDIIEGSVIKLNTFKDSENSRQKIPHVGWAGINLKENDNSKKWEKTLLYGLNKLTHMYFVHSYYVKPDNEDDILSISSYGNTNFCSSIHRKNIFGCQFHPERSGNNGLLIYRNFKKVIECE